MKNFKPFYRSNKMSKFLFEQEEEDLFATDEPAEDEPAEEEAEEDAETEGGEEEGTEEEAEEEISPEDEGKLTKVIDDDLEALMVDFETQARQSKKIEKESTVSDTVAESLGMRFLFESDYAVEIDLERFTSEIARLIKNYDTLLDMEELILSKAKSFIIARYGDEAANDMEESLVSNHDIEIEAPPGIPDGAASPVAVGAGVAAGG